MAGRQDIVLAPVSLPAPSSGPNPADIICAVWDPTPSNIIMRHIAAAGVLGAVVITMLAMPAPVVNPQTTVTLCPVSVLAVPSPTTLVMAAVTPQTTPTSPSPTSIKLYAWDATPANIIMQGVPTPLPSLPTVQMTLLGQPPNAVAPPVTLTMFGFGGPFTPGAVITRSISQVCNVGAAAAGVSTSRAQAVCVGPVGIVVAPTTVEKEEETYAGKIGAVANGLPTTVICAKAQFVGGSVAAGPATVKAISRDGQTTVGVVSRGATAIKASGIIGGLAGTVSAGASTATARVAYTAKIGAVATSSPPETEREVDVGKAGAVAGGVSAVVTRNILSSAVGAVADGLSVSSTYAVPHIVSMVTDIGVVSGLAPETLAGTAIMANIGAVAIGASTTRIPVDAKRPTMAALTAPVTTASLLVASLGVVMTTPTTSISLSVSPTGATLSTQVTSWQLL